MPAVLDDPMLDTDTDTRTAYQPRYAVVVLNDEDHTFDYVINMFLKVFRYETEKCFLLTREIHEKGRAIVWTGSLEVAELKKEQIQSMGRDFFNEKKVVDYPLGVELEPLP